MFLEKIPFSREWQEVCLQCGNVIYLERSSHFFPFKGGKDARGLVQGPLVGSRRGLEVRRVPSSR